jgi:hypothetical protein
LMRIMFANAIPSEATNSLGLDSQMVSEEKCN